MGTIEKPERRETREWNSERERERDREIKEASIHFLLRDFTSGGLSRGECLETALSHASTARKHRKGGGGGGCETDEKRLITLSLSLIRVSRPLRLTSPQFLS